MRPETQSTNTQQKVGTRLAGAVGVCIIGLISLLYILLGRPRSDLDVATSAAKSQPARPPSTKSDQPIGLEAQIKRANQELSQEEKDRLINAFKIIPPEPLPTPAEIEEFLKLSDRDDKSLAWAFVKSSNLKYLQEGLLSHPDSFLLHFIAARLPESQTASTPESQALTLQSLDWLAQSNPGVHGLLLATTSASPRPEWLEAINNADFKEIPETILDSEDARFLQGIRKFSTEDAKDYSSPGNYYHVKPLLMQLALLPSKSSTQLTALLALPTSNDVDSQAANIALQSAILKSPTLEDADKLLGESAAGISEKLRVSTEELESLRTLRQDILRSNDANSIEEFKQLTAKFGEIAALQQLRSQ